MAELTDGDRIIACINDPDKLRNVLKEITDINAKSSSCSYISKLNALEYAVTYCDIEIVRILLEHKANTTLLDENILSTLLWRSSELRVDIFQLLVDYGANINDVNYYDYAPIHTATAMKNIEAIRILLKFKVDVNMKGRENRTALHYAANGNWVEGARLLLENKADPNSVDYCSFTPLTRAATYENNIDVMRLLLEYGANVNWTNNYGWTALHSMACRNNIEGVTLLLEFNANAYLLGLDVTDHKYKEPLKCTKNQVICNLIKKHKFKQSIIPIIMHLTDNCPKLLEMRVIRNIRAYCVKY